MQILGLNQNNEMEYDSASEQTEDKASRETKLVLKPDTLDFRETVTQQTQASQGPDPIGVINKQLSELTVNLSRMVQ